MLIHRDLVERLRDKFTLSSQSYFYCTACPTFSALWEKNFEFRQDLRRWATRFKEATGMTAFKIDTGEDGAYAHSLLFQLSEIREKPPSLDRTKARDEMRRSVRLQFLDWLLADPEFIETQTHGDLALWAFGNTTN